MSKANELKDWAITHNVEYVDFRFTDLRGMWHHVTQHISTLDEVLCEQGLMFDGSSINGWKTINNSDMALIPDFETVVLDPFSVQPQAIVFCDVHNPEGGRYERDPRSITKRAIEYLKKSGVGETVYFGPEAEFFIFDDVRFNTQSHLMSYQLDCEEGPYNNNRHYPMGNMGHRPKVKGGYFPVAPLDKGADIRSEMLLRIKEMGVHIEKHHHEVAPGQHELGIKYDTLLKCADNMQIYKYVVKNVADSYGKTATFMPKPVVGDNGSGMHVHQSIWSKNKNLFSGDGYAGLSQMALYYIGGIIKHIKAINALTNPTTNSYKRLVPGFEAPVTMVYSASNRSAGVRIPYVGSENGKRIEARFPDPLANPYLAYTALLMAGIDGIKNKIDPGEALDSDLYDMKESELKGLPTVAHSLREALEALDTDRAFLTQDDVMTDSFIDAYIDLLMEDVKQLDRTTHPVEFEMYYSG